MITDKNWLSTLLAKKWIPFLSGIILLILPLFSFLTSYDDIFDAAKQGNLAKVQALVGKNPELVKAKDQEQSTPLHSAAAAGHLKIVEYLIEKEADVNAWNNAHQNPLLYAAYHGHSKIVSLLLEKGAEFKEQDIYGRNVLHYPAREGHPKVVEILVKKGLDINQEDRGGVTPLRFAIERGHTEIIDTFILLKALDVESDLGRKSLHLAAANGHKNIVGLLIAKGSSIHTRDDEAGTLLHNAAIGGLLELSQRLIKKGIKINDQDNRGKTPLHYAVREGHHEIVRLLAENGAELNIKGKDERTPLHIAEDWGRKEILDLLLEKKAVKVPRLEPKNPNQPWVGITYIANEGFLISSKTKKVLVDALFKNPYGYQDTPDEVLKKMVLSQPPFDRIDLMLFSHAHRDHFEPEVALKVLMNHPETMLVGNEIVCKELKEAAGESYAKINSRVKNINPEWGTIIQESINGMDLKIFPVNHSTPERPYMTLAYILDMDGTNVLHLGDIYPPANEKYFRAFQLQKENIAIAFIDPFFLLDEIGKQMATEFIQPKQIIPMHMRPNEVGKYARDLKKLYPNINVFWESMEKKLFEEN
jgi:ankyrin repeat protein/L-ascorbate metabolism protein UlaG (beta-lactamase superfamily)